MIKPASGRSTGSRLIAGCTQKVQLVRLICSIHYQVVTVGQCPQLPSLLSSFDHRMSGLRSREDLLKHIARNWLKSHCHRQIKNGVRTTRARQCQQYAEAQVFFG